MAPASGTFMGFAEGFGFSPCDKGIFGFPKGMGGVKHMIFLFWAFQ